MKLGHPTSGSGHDDAVEGRSTGSTGSSDFPGAPKPLKQKDSASTGESLTMEELRQNGQRLFVDLRTFVGRFIMVSSEGDLDVITLWIVHTYLAEECYTTPRLVIESAVPGSGKTTLLEHLKHLCLNPVLAGTVSSASVIPRLLQKGPHTLLIDEVDRMLDRKNPGSTELTATLNSGYKKGEGRLVNVPTKGGGWEVHQLPTFAPVALAGNSPHLAEDTRSRSITVLLLKDSQGLAEESNWQIIEPEAADLAKRLMEWSDQVRDELLTTNVELPEGVRGRDRERWAPLKRVATMVGAGWPEKVDRLAAENVRRIQEEVTEGLAYQRPHVVLLRDIAKVMQDSPNFITTEDLIEGLISHNPHMWGGGERVDKDLTAQGPGRMLVAYSAC